MNALVRIFVKGNPSTIGIILLFFLSATAVAQDFPERSNTIVTDYTSTLSPTEKQSLESKLVAFDDSTSTQVAIVMLSSIGGYDISDYAVQLYNKWGIGQKGKNNGILILVAKDDRKVFIATGYGMEGVLPDALAKRIVNNQILPNFREGRYYEGLDAAVNSIISVVKGEYTADEETGEKGIPWFGILLVIFILFVVFVSKVGSTKRYARRNNLGFWAAWALMNAAMNRSRGSWGGFSGGSGGFGGGGFGGFGGGMSGGGGAGGSW
jgi:uncharacterized protein